MKIKNLGKSLALGFLLNTVPLIANAQEPVEEAKPEEKNVIMSVNAGVFYPSELVSSVYGVGGNFSLNVGYKKSPLLAQVGLNYFETQGNISSSYETEFLFSRRTTANSSSINMKSIEPSLNLTANLNKINEFFLGGGPLAGILEEILRFSDKGIFSGEEKTEKKNKVFMGWHGKLGLKHKIGKNTYLTFETGYKKADVKDFPDIKLGGYEASAGFETRF